MAMGVAGQQCLARADGDSDMFGFALALTEDALLVGDPGANRVVLFRPDAAGRWQRAGVVRPPAGSAAAEAGRGFGRALAADGGRAVVGAYAETVAGVARRTPEARGAAHVSGLFVVSLDTGAVAPLVPDPELPSDTAFGFSVAIDGGRAAAGVRSLAPDRFLRGGVLLADLATRRARLITPPDAESAQEFGYAVALSGNRLLASALTPGSSGGAFVRSVDGAGGWRPLAGGRPPVGLGRSVALTERVAVLGGSAVRIVPHTGAPQDLALAGEVAISDELIGVLRTAGGAQLPPPGGGAVPLTLHLLGDPGAPPLGHEIRAIEGITGRGLLRRLALHGRKVAVSAPAESRNCPVIALWLAR